MQEGREELLHVQGQEGRLVQGKEQWLCFAGAAMKRYPMPKVRETQVSQSQGGTQSPTTRHGEKVLASYALTVLNE